MYFARLSLRTVRKLTRISLFVVLIAIGGLLSACGDAKTAVAPEPNPATSSFTYPVTITDDASRTITIEAEPQRIVSLAPANTEILFELGLGERVVGVTTYDDYPAEVKSIAKVGDFVTPNLEAVAAVDPDLVFVATGVQADAIAKLEELGAIVVAMDPQDLEGLYEDIGEMAVAAGVPEEGSLLAENMRTTVDGIRSKVADAKPVTAFVEIGQNPLYTVGSETLMNELVTLAGGTNVVTTAGYVPYSIEELVKADPQVYLVTKGVASDPSAIEKRAGYASLSAVKADRIVILEDNLVSRPGPRIVQGLQQIAEGLHPEIFGK